MSKLFWYFILFTIIGVILSACAAPLNQNQVTAQGQSPTDTSDNNILISQPNITTTPLPKRPQYSPGDLVDYIAQTGDSLASIASHFNSSVQEILAANTFIPADASTMPPGMPMKIPIYYQPFWGTQYQILPDGLFINGPAQVGFDTTQFVEDHPGWLKSFSEYAFNDNHTGAEIIDYVALNYSVSPRVLLALLEYQDGALSSSSLAEEASQYPLGYHDWQHVGLYMQLVWAANTLNNGYYGWRNGDLVEFEHLDGTLDRIDPWQNAATVALQYYFSKLFDGDQYARTVAQDGFAQTYENLFGDPWLNVTPHIPGSLVQPDLTLPFLPGITWAYTGGPHTGFGTGEPWAAIDFAPGAISSGCVPTDEWATAVASGVIARSEQATVVLDLDGDGDERTGWVIFYFHVGTEGRVPLGKVLQAGDPIGHPSCEGGRTTGTHIHIARKYNGEWMSADGIVPYNLGGWIVHKGSAAYDGTLAKGGRIIIACTCAGASSQINADK